MSKLYNMLCYQAVWCSSVYGAAHGVWWAGLALLTPFALWQLRTSRCPRADLRLLALAAVLGFAVDSMFAGSGLLHYASPLPSPSLAPVWIVGMWMGFALTLNHSLAFLQGKLTIALVLGAIAGPIAYWIAGSAWGAVSFEHPAWPALLALGLAWGVATPALSWLSARLARAESAPLAI